jgi:hypothetical protein
LPLGSLDSNNIAKGSMLKMFKDFSNCDLAIVALCLEEENEENKKSFMEVNEKPRFFQIIHG